MKKAGKAALCAGIPAAVSIATGAIGFPAAIGPLVFKVAKSLKERGIEIDEEDISEQLVDGFNEGISEKIVEKIKGKNTKSAAELTAILDSVLRPELKAINVALDLLVKENLDMREVLEGWIDEQKKIEMGFGNSLDSIIIELNKSFEEISGQISSVGVEITESRIVLDEILGKMNNVLYKMSQNSVDLTDAELNAVSRATLEARTISSEYGAPYDSNRYIVMSDLS